VAVAGREGRLGDEAALDQGRPVVVEPGLGVLARVEHVDAAAADLSVEVVLAEQAFDILVDLGGAEGVLDRDVALRHWGCGGSGRGR
jgi:hypothetical protein